MLENLDQDRCELEILKLMETSAPITPFSRCLTNHSSQRELQMNSLRDHRKSNNWEENAVSGWLMKQQGGHFTTPPGAHSL